MKKLVEELLLITRLENNYFTQKFEQADLGELVTKVYNECEMIDATHSFELTRVDHCLVKCNESLILQALRALADNSMKYTPAQGKICFSCTETANRCILSVTDTGIGIPESELENVRRRFFRVDGDRSRETGGTGLGLSIIESIVKLHRGELVIESTLGQGTNMKIILIR